MVSPYFSFQKTDDLFSHRLWRVMTFLAVIPLDTLQGVTKINFVANLIRKTH